MKNKCKRCGRRIPKGQNVCDNCNRTFIDKAKKIHGDKYDYSKVKYSNSKHKITIVCFEHGEFKQTPNNHLQGKGCSKCGGTKKLTTEEFIEKAKLVHDNLFEYSKVNYLRNNLKVKITCSIHGIFEQQPDSHLQGIGCPICSASKGEILVSNFLIKNGIFFKPQHKFPKCKHKRLLAFDFYLPDHNMCIEYDGLQHYKSVKYFGGDVRFEDQKIKDNIKNDFCLNNNIKLIRINGKNKINETLKKEFKI